MLRWMDPRTIGDTLFNTRAIDEQGQLEIENDANGGKLPVDVPGEG